MDNKKKHTVTLDTDTVAILKEVSKQTTGEENISLGIRLLAKKHKEFELITEVEGMRQGDLDSASKVLKLTHGVDAILECTDG